MVDRFDRRDVLPPWRGRSASRRWQRRVLLLSAALGIGLAGDRLPSRFAISGPTASSAPVRGAAAILESGSVVHLGPDGRPDVPTPATADVASATPRGALRPVARTLIIEAAPGGGEMVMLDARLARDTVARRDRNSRLTLDCERPADGPSHAPK